MSHPLGTKPTGGTPRERAPPDVIFQCLSVDTKQRRFARNRDSGFGNVLGIVLPSPETPSIAAAVAQSNAGGQPLFLRQSAAGGTALHSSLKVDRRSNPARYLPPMN